MRGESVYRFLVAWLGLIAAIVGCAAPDAQRRESQEPPAAASADAQPELTPEQQAFQERLRRALALAQAHPERSVNINLDERPGEVQPGDVVEVDLAYTVESGADCSSASARRFTQANNGRRGLLVGRSAPLPGLDRLPAMRKGEHQSVTLSPEHAFGRRDPGRISIYPRRKTLPVEFLMPAIPDAQGCSGEPVVGRIVDLSQPIRAEVLKVVDHRWVVRVLACHGERFEAPYGVTEARIAGQEVAFELTPRVGAPLPGPEGVGTILSAGAENFTVDFNHPLAGCALRLDLTVRAIHKASALEAVEIAWRSDGEELSAADGHGEKPTVLVLYAGWCAWSQKMLAESLQDPLVLSLADRFAWRKIDSSERPSLKETYRQNSYPLIVVLSKEGEEIGRLEGFQSGDALYAYLDRLWRGVEDIQ